MRALKVVGIFALGMVVGISAMAYLASRASTTYSRSLEISYCFDQQRKGAIAAGEGQWLGAAIAYHNVATAAEPGASKPFGVAQEWDPWFPFASLVLERTSAAGDPEGRGKRAVASITRAQYALVLERGGHREEAAKEWKRALSYGFFESADSARSTAITLLDQDIKFFSDH